MAEALLADGVYRSQFETGITAGSPSAFPGGERDLWEERIFGGAYRGAAPAERPRYGGLNLLHHADGACPRFGSCHLRLRPEVLERCTFCYGDSHMGPADVGTIDALDPVLAALFEEAASTGFVLGRWLDVEGLADFLRHPRPVPENGRALDHYVEAQVHGTVFLEDAEALVADPSFQGTPTGSALEAIAARHGLALSWHEGFELEAHEVPSEFRGPAIPPLARRLAERWGGPVDAALVGRGAASLVREPHLWPEGTWQHLKQLWHVLVAFGRPRRGSESGSSKL